MSRSSGPVQVVLALAAVLAALSAVAWRQSTARVTMERLDGVERDLALAADEREDLGRRLMLMEGRPWVGSQASRRLGLRAPRDGEVMILPGSLP